MVGQESYIMAVIGDFNKEDVRSFFDKLARTPVSPEDWGKCFDVFGGNPGYLKACAAAYDGSNMTSVLDRLINPIRIDIRDAAGPLESMGYSTEAYLAIARALIHTENHRLPKEEALNLLVPYSESIPEGPQKTLKALIRRGVISVRFRSDWATDIPEDAFKEDDLVVAASAARLYCMKRYLPAYIKEWKATPIGTS